MHGRPPANRVTAAAGISSSARIGNFCFQKCHAEGVVFYPKIRIIDSVRGARAMTKSNIHKKMTFEDKFDRHFACWVKNNRKRWRHHKVEARRKFRREMKKFAELA